MNRTEYIQRFTTTVKRYEDKYLSKVKAVLMPKDLIRAIEYHGNIEDGISYLRGWLGNPELSAVVQDLYLEVGLRFARMNEIRMRDENPIRSGGRSSGSRKFSTPGEAAQLKAAFGFNATWTQFIKEYLRRFLIEKITFDVSTTTRDYLLKYLQQSIDEGLSVDQTVKNLEDLPFLKYQTARIVRTETGRAANVGTKAQSETFPYEQMKEWISAHDRRVRGVDPKDHASHIDLDGIRINAGDLFEDPRNGDLLDHPGDPKASAASTINCRCSVAYTAKRDDNGNLIPKRQTTTVIFPRQIINRPTITI